MNKKQLETLTYIIVYSLATVFFSVLVVALDALLEPYIDTERAYVEVYSTHGEAGIYSSLNSRDGAMRRTLNYTLSGEDEVLTVNFVCNTCGYSEKAIFNENGTQLFECECENTWCTDTEYRYIEVEDERSK